MDAASAVIESPIHYQQLLEKHSPLFILFVSKTCSACEYTIPNFQSISEKYAESHGVKSLILDTADTPKLEQIINQVTGTPTLLVYRNAEVVENMKGIGYPDEQEEILEDLFSEYTADEFSPVSST